MARRWNCTNHEGRLIRINGQYSLEICYRFDAQVTAARGKNKLAASVPQRPAGTAETDSGTRSESNDRCPIADSNEMARSLALFAVQPSRARVLRATGKNLRRVKLVVITNCGEERRKFSF